MPPAEPIPPPPTGSGSMRVALFTDTLADVNGVSRFVRDMARQAALRGRDFTAYTSTPLPLEPGLPTVNFPPRAAWPMPAYPDLRVVPPPLHRVLGVLRTRRPDVVHISTPGPVGLAARLAAARLGLPMVGTFHTDFAAYVDRLIGEAPITALTSAYLRWFYRPFTGVLTRSGEYARRLVAQGFAPERVCPLRPGTDTLRFSPDHADASIWPRLGLPPASAQPGCVKVLYVGRLSREKNTDLLASVWPSALARAGERGARAHLVLVGDGPDAPALRRRLDPQSATFLGFRHGAELSAIYASSDLLVFPSITDTLGQVVLEAQASGLGVLVSDVGGPQEVVADGHTGLVLPAGKPGRWVDALAGLIVDEPRRRGLGEAARAHALGSTIGASFEHFWSVQQRAITSPR